MLTVFTVELCMTATGANGEFLDWGHGARPHHYSEFTSGEFFRNIVELTGPMFKLLAIILYSDKTAVNNM